MEGVSLGDAVVGVLGSYTVAGCSGRVGIWGRVVTDEEGWYAGERGRARCWGLEAGERDEACACAVRNGEGLVAVREGEGGASAVSAPLTAAVSVGPWVVTVRVRAAFTATAGLVLFFSLLGAMLLPWVLCDQRFRFPIPCLTPPMPSTAAPAALERRASRGGVALLWGCLGSAAPSLSEAGLCTVTIDDDESELLRDCGRRWAAAWVVAGGSAVSMAGGRAGRALSLDGCVSSRLCTLEQASCARMHHGVGERTLVLRCWSIFLRGQQLRRAAAGVRCCRADGSLQCIVRRL